MQEIIASVDSFKFDVETAIDQQLGTQPLPFPGMDSKTLISNQKNKLSIS